jgi:moderate conductance mechanosensitive channel
VSPLFLVPTTLAEWRDWLQDDAPKVATVLVVIAVVKLLSRPLIGRVLRSAARPTARLSGEDPAQIDRRIRTLEGTLSWLVTFVVGFIGVAVLLDTVGLNVTPIVAGVGVVGVSIGLGAQTLIRDVINGVFILIEDQYSVGDQVTVAGVEGEVLEISPRRTLIRDAAGNVHTVPNSTITTATNRTPGLRRVKVEFTVAFRDGELAAKAANDAARAVATAHQRDILVPPSVGAYAVTADGSLRITLTGEARPSARWEVQGELIRRLKRDLEDAHVDATFPGPETP